MMYAIVGPTASGKSGIGIELVKKNFSIINFDSCQTYDGLLTLKAVPEYSYEHYLYKIFNHNVRRNVVDWAILCEKTIHEIREKKRFPILIGGTGFYLRVLQEGIANLPEISKDIDLYVDQLPDNLVINMLQVHDPDSLKFQDFRRLRRSLKIWLQTGKSIFECNSNKIFFDLGNIRILALTPDINIIRSNIKNRLLLDFDKMVEEVRLNLGNLDQYFAVIGVKEIKQLLLNEINYVKCVELIFYRTCQYAKRQLTYIRNCLNVERVFVNSDQLINYIGDSCD